MSIAHIKKAIDLCVQIDVVYIHSTLVSSLTHLVQTKVKKTMIFIGMIAIGNTNYKKATSNIFSALDDIIKYAQSRKIKIAIETEGSVKEKPFINAATTEYDILLNKYSSSDLGINLNIRHLNLASKALVLIINFVNLISNSISSIERIQ